MSETIERRVHSRAVEGTPVNDWRDIPMLQINWKQVHSHIGIPAHKLRRLSLPPVNDHAPTPYGTGCWSTLTLGQVADLGAHEILRHQDVGKVALAGLQYIIDLAAAGKLATYSDPAPDALRPTKGDTP